MSISSDDKMLEKLNQILKVLATQVGTGKNTGERVHLLKVAGLDNQTVAEILEISPDAVRALESQQKSKRRKPKQNRDSNK